MQLHISSLIVLVDKHMSIDPELVPLPVMIDILNQNRIKKY